MGTNGININYLIYLYIFENAFATHVNSIIGDAGEEKQYQIDQIG